MIDIKGPQFCFIINLMSAAFNLGIGNYVCGLISAIMSVWMWVWWKDEENQND